VSDEGTVETVMNSVTYVAHFRVTNGMMHLRVDGYGETTSHPILGVSNETSATFFLRQFVRTLDTDEDAR
jgi:hypothetical protein